MSDRRAVGNGNNGQPPSAPSGLELEQLEEQQQQQQQQLEDTTAAVRDEEGAEDPSPDYEVLHRQSRQQLQPHPPRPPSKTAPPQAGGGAGGGGGPSGVAGGSRGSQHQHTLVIGADKGADTKDSDGFGICGWVLTFFSYFIVGITFPMSMFVCLKVVQEYERAVIFRLGRLIGGGAKGPGIFFVLPCIESYSKVDLRTVSFDVPPQEVLTKDSVTVSVDAVVYYRVSNATVSVANVENAHHSTRLLAQTTLRNVLGTKNLAEILSERENISNSMQDMLASATDSWGICVERVEIKDVRLPVQLQRVMAAEAEADREARAKIIAAEGEQKASRALKEASDVISESPTAMQLRYLQTLTSISAEKNSTIIFPLPLDFMAHFVNSVEYKAP